MWKWIAKEVKNGSKDSNDVLKELWLEKNKKQWEDWATHSWLENDCPFCEYSYRKDKVGQHICTNCPARLLNPKLRRYWCEGNVSWQDDPRKFYQKIQRLNRKR